jgi:ABC-type xylose transport system permease subunit
MVLIDALLILAMMFFLFLPITDRRTVQMKLCVLCALLMVFAVTATRTHGSHVQLAGIESTR